MNQSTPQSASKSSIQPSNKTTNHYKNQPKPDTIIKKRSYTGMALISSILLSMLMVYIFHTQTGIVDRIGLGFLLAMIHTQVFAKGNGIIYVLLSVAFFTNNLLAVGWFLDSKGILVVISLALIMLLGVAVLALNRSDDKKENIEKLLAEIFSMASLASLVITVAKSSALGAEIKAFADSEKNVVIALLYAAIFSQSVSITLKIRIAYRKFIEDRESEKNKTGEKKKRELLKNTNS